MDFIPTQFASKEFIKILEINLKKEILLKHKLLKSIRIHKKIKLSIKKIEIEEEKEKKENKLKNTLLHHQKNNK